MSAWLLLLSLAFPAEPGRKPMVFQHRLEHVSREDCLRLGHEIADKFERGGPDRRIVVECVKAGKRT